METELWCEDCGAQFRNNCTCSPIVFDGDDIQERWVGIDGHAYIGNPRRSSLAYHDTDNCKCPSSSNFDPDSWY